MVIILLTFSFAEHFGSILGVYAIQYLVFDPSVSVSGGLSLVTWVSHWNRHCLATILISVSPLSQHISLAGQIV